MDEAVVTDIDPHVRERAVQGIEEHQITGTQLVAADRTALAGDVGGTAADFQAGGLAENVADHAAAIETRLRIFAAKAITGIDQRQSIKSDIGPGRAGGTTALRYSFPLSGRTRCRAATGSKQERDTQGGQEGRQGQAAAHR